MARSRPTMAPRTSDGDRHDDQDWLAPQLYPSTATQSTTSSPGKKASAGKPPTSSWLTDQIQPSRDGPSAAASKAACTRRHMVTKSAGELAPTAAPHGYQLPFISWPSRR